MIDKGLTKNYLQSIGRRYKKGDEFNLSELTDIPSSMKSSVTKRFIIHKIIEKIGVARYRLLVDEPFKTYREKIDAWRHSPRGVRKDKKVLPAMPNSHGHSTQHHVAGPEVKIVAYGDYDMIFIGRRIFLATEVVLTPKKEAR